MADELSEQDLSDIRAEIERLKAENAALESAAVPDQPDTQSEPFSLSNAVATLLGFPSEQPSPGMDESITGPVAKAGYEAIQEDPNAFGRGASAALGGAGAALASGPAALLTAPLGATVGSQAWDAFARYVTGNPTPDNLLEQAGGELATNAAIDAATLGTGKILKGGANWVTSNFGKEALLARKAQSPEAFSAMVGNAGHLTNASEGEAKLLARQVDNLVESNALLGKEFNPQTGKFVGEVGSESLEQMRERLGRKTLSLVAETRDGFLRSLDDGASSLKAVPVSKGNLDLAVPQELIARVEQSGENAETVKYLDGIVNGFLDDIGDASTFKKAQELVSNQYDKAEALRAFDPVAQTRIPPSQGSRDAYERDLRMSLANSLRKAIQRRADDIGDVIGVKAPSGEMNSAYIDRLNDVYTSTKTFHEDLDSFIVRQIGGTGPRPGQSLVQTDLSRVDPRAPLSSIPRMIMGEPLERMRQNQIFKDIDFKIPEQLRAFVQARANGPASAAGSQGIIDPLATGAMASLFALTAGAKAQPLTRTENAIDVNALTEKLISYVGPEDAMAQIQQVQMAKESGDPIAAKKAYGILLQINPELRNDFMPGHTIAQSEFDGIIADPMEKDVIKAKLSASVRAGAESSIAASKFISYLNADRPFKRSDVPKSLRSPRARVEDTADLGQFGAMDILPPQ